MSRSKWIVPPCLLVLLTTAIQAELIGHWAMDPVDVNATGQDVFIVSRVGGKKLAGRLIADAHLETNVTDGTITRRSALALDGQRDCLRIEHPVATFGRGHDFTVAAWIKTDAAGMAILSKDNANGKLEPGEKIFFVKERFGGREVGWVGCGQHWISANNPKVNDGQWHHVAVVYNAMLDTRILFVDGQNVTSESSFNAGPDHGDVVRIGISDWKDAADFRGHIDDLLIFDQPLSPRQIRTLISNGPSKLLPLPLDDLLTRKSDDDPWSALMHARRILADHRKAQIDDEVQHAGLILGPWYCAGPFRRESFGILAKAFDTLFPPEEQVVNARRQPIDLTRTWQVERLPDTVDTTRGWVEHPGWLDGYRHLLPLGPSPGRNETCYLYRTITARNDVSVEMDLYAEDRIRVWLNGSQVAQASNKSRSSSRYPANVRTQLKLRKGENRLLVKVSSMFGRHGFSFALPLITPTNSYRSLGRVPADISGRNHFTPSDLPLIRETPEANPEADEAAERLDWASKDGIPTEATPAKLHDAYSEAILRTLRLPQAARRLLPKVEDAVAVGELRNLHVRAHRYRTALKRLKSFHFKPQVAPMFDPPRLVIHDMLESSAPSSPGGRAYLDRLSKLQPQVEDALRSAELSEPDAFEKVIGASESIEQMWREVASELPPIAFTRYPVYPINAIAPYDAPESAKSPASICIVDPSRPTQPARTIYDDPTGALFDMNVSFDAKTLFFSARSAKRSISQHDVNATPADMLDSAGRWHIFEISISGKHFKRITHGSSNNISPIELPSGKLMFVSTRMDTRTMCQPRRSGLLFVSERDGSNVRRVSSNTLSDHTPQVMDDGRILFTRWDYGIDKNVFARQTLWTMNPNGTRFQLFFGSTIEDPNGFWEARPIAGRPEVLSVFGPHHNYHAGMIGLVWNRAGIEAPRGVGFRWITQETPVIGDLAFPWGYQDPLPINERLFLVSYGGDGERKNRIYLIDDRGNKKCLVEDDVLGCWNPCLIRPRSRPPVLSTPGEPKSFVYRDPVEANRNPNHEKGVYMIQDVYQGLPSIVKRGEIRAIQILEQVPKSRTSAVGLSVWGYQTTISRGTMFVRRLIGTVPVESDGSAYFEAPAYRDISFNALDSNGKTLKRMGSTTQIMPGETQGCIGCHERRENSPANLQMPSLALRRRVSTPQRPDWGTNGILDFVNVVQPILDQHCVECHSGAKPDGLLDLSADKTAYFNMAYNQLVDRDWVQYLGPAAVGHGKTSTRALGSQVSRICRYFESDHHGVKVPDRQRRTIYTWIDANIPYYSTYQYTNGHVMGARDRWYVHDKDKWFQKDFLPIFSRRCQKCHERPVEDIHIYNYNPGRPVMVTSDTWPDSALNQFQFGYGRPNYLAQIGPAHRINLTHPEWSLMLTAPLAKSADGLGLCQPKEGLPQPFRNRNDPDYRAMLRALEVGRDTLLSNPRVDMQEPK